MTLLPFMPKGFLILYTDWVFPVLPHTALVWAFLGIIGSFYLYVMVYIKQILCFMGLVFVLLVCLSISLSACLSTSLSFYPCQSLCLCQSLSVSLPVSLSVSASLCLSDSLCLNVYISHTHCLNLWHPLSVSQNNSLPQAPERDMARDVLEAKARCKARDSSGFSSSPSFCHRQRSCVSLWPLKGLKAAV